MKYESNILKRLIDTYGVVGNPRYLSEIIKEFIVRGKELYPQLFTYQADWLAHIDEFGLTPEYVVSYTGQQIYAPHTKERPVKRAILKGNTTGLETNLFDGEFIQGDYASNGIFTGGTSATAVKNKINVVENKDYLLSYTKEAACRVTFMNGNTFISSNLYSSGDTKITIPNLCNNVLIHFGTGIYDNTIDLKFSPMFLTSVKMPVLTTMNVVNLLDVKQYEHIGASEYIFNNIIDSRFEKTFTFVSNGNFYNSWVKPFETNEFGEKIIGGWNFDVQSEKVGVNNKLCFTVPNDVDFFKLQISHLNRTEQLSYGFNDYSYGELKHEPFKSNILTVNEDVTLRSNGSVCDELDLLTGKLTQRIGEDGGILTQEVVKTVDLTVKDQNDIEVSQLSSFNGGTHFTTSSQDGSLLPTLIVDVVTDLEETLNLCSTDGNTL